MDWTKGIGKIIGVGRNYAQHARELGNAIPTQMVLFGKMSSSLLPHGNGGSIIIPNGAIVHHEVELGVVMGKRAKCVTQHDAMMYVKVMEGDGWV